MDGQTDDGQIVIRIAYIKIKQKYIFFNWIVINITIFQECMMGYYGKNCSNKCSAFCNITGRCDKITGHCDGGCKPGWTGKSCDQKKSIIKNISYRNILVHVVYLFVSTIVLFIRN